MEYGSHMHMSFDTSHVTHDPRHYPGYGYDANQVRSHTSTFGRNEPVRCHNVSKGQPLSHRPSPPTLARAPPSHFHEGGRGEGKSGEEGEGRFPANVGQLLAVNPDLWRVRV